QPDVPFCNSRGALSSCGKAIPVSRMCCSPAYFFFQAEDGIRDPLVTGVQTCALPIFAELGWALPNLGDIDYQTISGAISTGTHRSEERRVGKECRSRGGARDEKKDDVRKRQTQVDHAKRRAEQADARERMGAERHARQ